MIKQFLITEEVGKQTQKKRSTHANGFTQSKVIIQKAEVYDPIAHTQQHHGDQHNKWHVWLKIGRSTSRDQAIYINNLYPALFFVIINMGMRIRIFISISPAHKSSNPVDLSAIKQHINLVEPDYSWLSVHNLNTQSSKNHSFCDQKERIPCAFECIETWFYSALIVMQRNEK